MTALPSSDRQFRDPQRIGAISALTFKTLESKVRSHFPASNRWVARFWIRNIGNEDNIVGRLNRQRIVYGDPRIYGISLRYNVGDEGS